MKEEPAADAEKKQAEDAKDNAKADQTEKVNKSTASEPEAAKQSRF